MFNWTLAKLAIILACLMKLIEFNLYSVILIIKFFNCVYYGIKDNIK